jgi:DNA replication protein DnaC
VETLFQDVKKDIIDKLQDSIGSDSYGCDLHNSLCNSDYFIIGTYKAKKWLGSNSFEAIELIRDYEKSNFGEVNTDFSDPERVANMVAYILGERILNQSDTLSDNYDLILDSSDLEKISYEVAKVDYVN